MWKACVVDSEYGSMRREELDHLVTRLRGASVDLRLAHCKTPEEIIASCGGMDAILCCGNPPVTREVMEQLPSLKVVQRFGIGVNSVDLRAAEENGVLVLYLPGFCVEELAVHATALALGLLRNIGYYDRGIRQGEWRKAQGAMPRSPGDMTLGLFGFGGSARLLYRMFRHGFLSRVITYDPFPPPDFAASYDAEAVSFEELLARSDILSVHAPLTEETKHTFNREAFRKMKNDAMIINVARGPLICQEDLIEALRTGEIGFAGLDVFEEEPLPADSPLLTMENVLLTCHSAFYGANSKASIPRMVTELLDGIINRSCVDRRYVANPDVRPKDPAIRIVS